MAYCQKTDVLEVSKEQNVNFGFLENIRDSIQTSEKQKLERQQTSKKK